MQGDTSSKPVTHQDSWQTRSPKSLDCMPESITKAQNESTIVQNSNAMGSEAMYIKLILEGKADHTVYGNLGVIRAIQGRYDDTIELTQKALKLKPDHYNYLNNLGNAEKAKGNTKEAMRYYKMAIVIKPEFADAHNNLGTLLQDQGLFDEAINSYNQALKWRVDYAEAYNNLGVSLTEIDCLDEAIEAYTKAINLKANYEDAYYNLGNTFLKKGDQEKALESYVKTLQLNPNYAKALVSAGLIFINQGEAIAAISSYKKAIQLDPYLAEAHYNLGSALEEYTDYTKALECFTNALNLFPNDARSHAGISSNLMHIGNIDQAIQEAKKAISIDPMDSSYYCILSRCEQALGDLNASKSTLHKALKLNPYNPNILYLLSKQIIDKSEAENLLQLTGEISLQGQRNRESISLEFAIANCLHKSKKYDQASLHLARANELKLIRRPSDISKWQETTKKTLNNLSRFQDAHPQDGNNRIFIVGVPRCGSTLLESILATNSFLKDLGETKALPQTIKQILDNTESGRHYTLSKLYDKKIDGPMDRTKTIDKNLYNFVNVHHIARLMPSAKIIHCHRHPLDNILSMLRANLVHGNNYTSSPADAARMIIIQEQVLKQAKKDYPDQIFTVNYDALVNSPEQVIKPLIAWLGLEWSESYLHPETVKRTILTASVVQARKPISNKSVGGWKNYKSLLEPAIQILRDSSLFNDSVFEESRFVPPAKTFSFF